MSSTAQLSFSAGDMPGPGKQLVSGLNPPFGRDGAKAREFVEHTTTVTSSRAQVYILPQTGVPRHIPGYTLMLEDMQFLADK